MDKDKNTNTDKLAEDPAEGFKVYALADLAPLLGVTYRTLLTYVKTKKLKAVKIGGRWKVTPENWVWVERTAVGTMAASSPMTDRMGTAAVRLHFPMQEISWILRTRFILIPHMMNEIRIVPLCRWVDAGQRSSFKECVTEYFEIFYYI